MTPPRPAESESNRPEDQIDLLADAPPPPVREIPVRPRQLDAARPLDPSGPVAVRTPAAPAAASVRPPAPSQPSAPPDAPAPAPAATRASEHAADGPFPCPKCRYDLRGRPGGTRCPECGTLIPSRRIASLRPGERRSVRDTVFSSWYALSSASLASAYLVSPFPWIIPLGIALTVCAGFAPAFRLFATRPFEELPPVLREPVEGLVKRFRWLQRVELSIAGVIAVGAALGTFGVLGSKAIPAYLLGVFAWWVVSVLGLAVQIRLGDTLSRLLVDPELLPLEAPARMMRWLAGALLAGLAAGALALYAAIDAAGLVNLPAAGLANTVSSLLLLATFAAHVVCALHARAHAILVANCAFESELFRKPRFGGAREDDATDAVPAARRHATTPRDDGPISLPGE